MLVRVFDSCIVASYLDAAAFVKAKINNHGILALGKWSRETIAIGKGLIKNQLGYTQALRPGVKASFGLALDTQRLNETTPSGPAHKVSDLLNLKFVGPILIERYL